MRWPSRPVWVRAGFPLLAAAAWALLPAAQTSPKTEERWYKGNLHTHTINSDGDSSPDAVARWYKEHRYHFLFLTDHDYRTNPDGLNSIFAAEERFLLIAGEEVSSAFEEKPLHVNGLNVLHTVPPVFGEGVVDTLQKNVDAILAAGGLPSLNHPNFRWAVTPDELAQIRNLHLFEIFNGSGTNDLGGGGVPGLEAMWDIVLSSGNRVYGIAVDDAHDFKAFGPQYSNPGRGWVHVKARELSTAALLEAIEKGRFYASTGVELDVEWLSDGLRIDIIAQDDQNAQDDQYDDRKYTTDFIGKDGKLLHRSIDISSSYALKPGEPYVRAKVLSSQGEAAWAQPVFAR